MMARIMMRARRAQRGDAGYTLIMVMMIGILVIIMLTTATTTLLVNIRPAANSKDDGAALAAAEAAVEDFIQYANKNCSSAPLVCPSLTLGLSNPSVWPANLTTTQGTTFKSADGTNTNSKASFLWKIIGCDSGGGGGGCAGVRLQAVGQYPNGTGGPAYRTKTLIADVLNSPAFNDFQYYTHYETLSPDYLKNLYTARNIHIDHTQISNSDYNDSQFTGASKNLDGTLHWNGVPAAQLNVCNALYQSRVTGMSNGTYPNVPPPGYGGSDFAWFNETGTFPTLNPTHWDICDVAFEREMSMNGPLYTQDRFLLNTDTNASCPGSNNNKQPLFNNNPDGTVAQAFSLQSTGAGDYRTYATFQPGGGGGGVPGGVQCSAFPVAAPPSNPLDLKDGNTLQDTFLNASGNHAQCIYTGPTRILSKVESVLGVPTTVLYITSPYTPVNNTDTCYRNYTTSAATVMNTNNPSGGVVEARIPLSYGDKPLIYIKNPSPFTPLDYTTLGSALTRTKVFDLQGTPTAPAAATDPALVSGDYTVGWNGTYDSTSTCPSPNGSKRRTFDCENSSLPTPPDVFTALRAAVNTYLSTSSGQDDAAFQTGIRNAFKPAGTPANWTTTQPSAASPMTNGQILYYVSAAKTATTPSPVSGSVPSLAVADPFLQNVSAGSATYSRTLETWTVTVTRYACAKAVGCNSDTDWSKDQQYTSANVKHYLADVPTSLTNSKTAFPWVGTSNYQQPTDITPYDPRAGDAYVEGTVKRAGVEIVADNDIFMTNTTQYDASDPAKTDGWAFVAGENIRIYRPVSCVNDDPTGTTSPNWCPNDLTGADDTPSQTTFSSQYPPSLQYCAAGDNGTPCAGWAATWMGRGKGQSAQTDLYGTFFTMGFTDPAATARRGGSFMVDNVGRASDNGTLTINGGLYQYHRGITKFVYKLHAGGINRPGLTFHYAYDNMEDSSNRLRVQELPLPSGSSSGAHKWSITGMSTP